MLFDAARKGDSTANEIINAAADMHGIGIVNLLHLYSPEILIFGGGLAHGFDTLADGIQTVSSAPPFRDVPVVPAELAGNSGLIGIAAMVFDQPAAIR